MTAKKEEFHKIGVITKIKAKHYLPVLTQLVSYLNKQKKEIYLDLNCSSVLGKRGGLDKTEMLRKVSMAIVLGGDGTLLKVARKLSTKKVQVLGVNMGNVGFLTETSPRDMIKALGRVFKGHYVLDERLLLRVTVYRNGKKYWTSLALNDAVINQGGFARLIDLFVSVNKRKLALYRADGLIVATPTGSTGHSLSGGGPIVHPRIEGLLLTPICPVKLGFRPILIPNNRQISIELKTEWRAEKKPIVLTIDGQLTINLKRGDVIRIRTSSRTFNMIRMTGHNYYRMLRKKLNWGE